MKITLEVPDPAEVLPEHYSLYDEVRQHLGSNPRGSIPPGIAHISSDLDIPRSMLSRESQERFAALQSNLAASEVAAFTTLEQLAFQRTQLLFIGRKSTAEHTEAGQQSWFCTYSTEVPLELGNDQPFKEVSAHVHIHTDEFEKHMARTISLCGVTLAISGRHTGLPRPDDAFWTHSALLTNFMDWADTPRMAETQDKIYIPTGCGVAPLFQYHDALAFVETHQLFDI